MVYTIGMAIHKVEKKDLSRFVRQCIESLKPFKEHATVVALSGELGAGKTTFTQEAALVLGVETPVTSPTFVIEKIYPLTHSLFSRLIHIDAYRLSSGEELAKLGWKDLLEDPKNLIFIEWPENVLSVIPKDTMTLVLTVIDEDLRTIEIKHA